MERNMIWKPIVHEIGIQNQVTFLDLTNRACALDTDISTISSAGYVVICSPPGSRLINKITLYLFWQMNRHCLLTAVNPKFKPGNWATDARFNRGRDIIYIAGMHDLCLVFVIH